MESKFAGSGVNSTTKIKTRCETKKWNCGGRKTTVEIATSDTRMIPFWPCAVHKQEPQTTGQQLRVLNYLTVTYMVPSLLSSSFARHLITVLIANQTHNVFALFDIMATFDFLTLVCLSVWLPLMLSVFSLSFFLCVCLQCKSVTDTRIKCMLYNV